MVFVRKKENILGSDGEQKFYWPLLKKSIMIRTTVGARLEIELAASIKSPLTSNHLIIWRVSNPDRVSMHDFLERASVVKPFRNFPRILKLSSGNEKLVHSNSVCWKYDQKKKMYQAIDGVIMFLSSEEMKEISNIIEKFEGKFL